MLDMSKNELLLKLNVPQHVMLMYEIMSILFIIDLKDILDIVFM